MLECVCVCVCVSWHWDGQEGDDEWTLSSRGPKPTGRPLSSGPDWFRVVSLSSDDLLEDAGHFLLRLSPITISHWSRTGSSFVFLFLTVSLKGLNQWVLLHVHQLIHRAVFVSLLYEQWQSQLFTELPGDKTDSYICFFFHCCSCAMCIKKPITVEPYLLGLIKFMCTVAMVTQWQLNLLKRQLKPPVWRLDELCALFTTEWLIFSQMW